MAKKANLHSSFTARIRLRVDAVEGESEFAKQRQALVATLQEVDASNALQEWLIDAALMRLRAEAGLAVPVSVGADATGMVTPVQRAPSLTAVALEPKVSQSMPLAAAPAVRESEQNEDQMPAGAVQKASAAPRLPAGLRGAM